METYVIRVGAKGEGDETSDECVLHGVVEHVGSGRRELFRDARELLAFLHSEHKPQQVEVDEQ